MLRAAGGVAFAAFDAFADAGGFAAPSAQVIELGAAHLALAHHLHGIDKRAIHREDALDAFTVRKLAYGEALVQPLAGAGDADALESLQTLARLHLLALLVIGGIDHLDVHLDGV